MKSYLLALALFLAIILTIASNIRSAGVSRSDDKAQVTISTINQPPARPEN